MHMLISRVAQLQQYEERRLKEFEDALNREAVSTAVTVRVSFRGLYCLREIFNTITMSNPKFRYSYINNE